jgi:hypothetical protein
MVHPNDNILFSKNPAIRLFTVPRSAKATPHTEVTVLSSEKVIAFLENNHQAQRTIKLETPIKTSSLNFKFRNSDNNIPISIFEIRCY